MEEETATDILNKRATFTRREFDEMLEQFREIAYEAYEKGVEDTKRIYGLS